MKKIGIIGAGKMGSGIAQKVAQEGLSVVLIDKENAFLEKGMEQIKSILQQGVDRRVFSSEEMASILSRIHPTLNKISLADCELVIEAVYEDFEIKKELFQEIERVCAEKIIFATNTSSLRVSELAETIRSPERMIGLHFFYHPAKNRLLEVVPGEKTDEETLVNTWTFVREIGSVPLLVQDRPGFAVNRFFVPWLNEAVRMLDEGMGDIPTIEQAGIEGMGCPMGPFALMNATGIPIAYHSALNLGKALGNFYTPSSLLKEQCESGKLWEIEGEPQKSKFQPIIDRFYGVVFYVVTSLVDEGTVSVEDVDRGARVGLRWKRGPFELMNKIGLDKAKELIENIKEKYYLSIPEVLVKTKKWEFSYVDLETKNNTAIIALNRPEALNALNEVVVNQLNERLNQAYENPDVKKITLEGIGKAFVAGADVKFFVDSIKKKDFEGIYQFTLKGHEVLNKIENSQKPVICKLTGQAIGGGAELVLATHFIISTSKGGLMFPETGLGIYPGLGGTQRLPRLIGKELAKYFIFTGFPITATLAQKLQLIDKIVPYSEMREMELQHREKYRREWICPPELQKVKEQFSDENIKDLLIGKILDSDDPVLLKVAKTLKRKSPIALKIANQLIDEGFERTLKEGLTLELSHIKEIFSSRDAYEGLSSLLEGRKPSFLKGNEKN